LLLADTGYHIMDRNQLFPPEKVKSMVDLGVRFDSDLTFRYQISEKINKAYSVIGNIKRNFNCFIYRVAQNKIPHRRICSISATSGPVILNPILNLIQ